MSPAEGISAELRLKIEQAERQAKEQRGRNMVCGSVFLLLCVCARVRPFFGINICQSLTSVLFLAPRSSLSCLCVLFIF